MKRSKHLCKRGENYYFRFSNRDINVKLSLRTNDLYEARYLRDRILDNISGNLMGKNITDKLKNTELLRHRAVDILKKEKRKNNGILDVSDKQITHYLPKNRVIKDQEFLEKTLRQYVTILEQDRITNGGRLPNHRVEDLKLWTDPDILYNPFTPEELQEMENSTIPYGSDAYDMEYMPKDRVELYVTMKEAFFNISIEYLAQHYSSPITPSNQDDYNKLVELGIVKRIEQEPSVNTTPPTQSISI